MSDYRSATIIVFPRKPAPPQEDPQARLQRALVSLDQALAEQREAIAHWRSALGALHGSMEGLGQSLASYQANLGALADGVDIVNKQARSLEEWADAVLAKPVE